MSPATRAVQLHQAKDPATGAVVPALQPATTFARNAAYEAGDYSYSRDRSPNVAQVEAVLADLEGGAGALSFASGLAAVAALFETVPPGQRVVAPEVMYHGTRRWLERLATQGGLELALFDPAVDGALEQALRPGNTAVVWIESLINPTWEVVDIEAAAEAAHRAGAILAVDATVTPPCTTRPLALGADVVFHSATKYLNGHSDVLAGVLVTRHQDEGWREIQTVRTLSGGVLGAFEAWLLLRGLRTLFVRFERASHNALTLARHFQHHPRIQTVRYPGLPEHPRFGVATRQMTGGFGGMVSLLIRGDRACARRVATATRVFVPATSLGGVESLIEHRKTIEGPDSPVADNLLRLSIGIEAVSDLIDDLEQALDWD
ncbi:MAG: trans-sulfuration enzyme family protein [Candidatus Competibacterales bacterium]